MFNAESYKKISDIVRGDVETTEKLIGKTVPEGNSLYESLFDFVMAPSKRIRSVLTFLYLRARGFEINRDVYEILALVELIHNASLIHDDVIDNDAVRRNTQSINAKFNNKIAVISGDYLLAMVMKNLTDIGKIELFKIFSKTIRCMCEGELNQYINLNRITSLDNYIEKTYKKTGSLFEAAVTSAVFTVNGKMDEASGEFGRNFGIAFQINDDLENVINDSRDIADGIYNAPVIFSGDKNITETGIEKTKILLNNYLDNTRRCIEYLDDSVYKSMILELLELFNGHRIN